MKAALSKSRSDAREALLALLLVALGAVALLIPVAYMVGGSFASRDTAILSPQSIIPFEARKVTLEGQPRFVYHVTIEGQSREWAVVDRKAGNWVYADPAQPSHRLELPALGPEDRVLDPVFHWGNFQLVAETIPIVQYLVNTLIMILLITAGTMVSNVMVAYGFARFRLKGTKVLFVVLLATIMLPSQVTLIPTFVMFKVLGWNNSWIPLILPAFFANAWNVFLIRQFLMSVPKELDEAAKIDGCGPIRTLLWVMLPELKPILITVALFTVIYVWNDFFNPLIYLQDPNLYPVSLGLQTFNSLHGSFGYLNAAASLMLALPPVIVFFFSQKYFIQGTVISGIKG
jgi:multiple sugar transport system permease protein